MAPRQPQTIEQAIYDVRSQILVRYLDINNTGLIDPKNFFLRSAERQLKNFNLNDFSVNDFIAYYSTLALLEAAKGNLPQAKEIYLKAIKLKTDNNSHFSNYNNIVLRSCHFEEAQQAIEEHFERGGDKYDLLFNLYSCCLRKLNFRSFNEMYNKVYAKDVLSKKSKEELENIYEYSVQLELMAEDLKYINIDIDMFSKFFDILYGFHVAKVYDQFNIRFQIENSDEQYLIVEVFVNVSTADAVALTIQFEDKLVKYAAKHGRSDILSKFLVYYKNKEMTQEEIDDRINIYLGMNEGLVV